MCDRTRTAIEIIQAQPRKTITKEETLMLFQKVIEDNEKIGVRMTNLEKRMETLETKMDAGFKDLKDLILKREHSLLYKILLGENAKYFWITIIVAMLLLGGLLGVPTTGFNGILNIGG